MKIDRDAPVGVFDSGVGGLMLPVRSCVIFLPRKLYISVIRREFHTEVSRRRQSSGIPVRSYGFCRNSR